MKRDEGEKDREGEGVGESYRSSRATSRIEWCPHRQVRRCAHCSTSRRLCAAQPIIIYSYLKVENVNSRYPYKYILHIRTSTLRPHMHRSVRDLLANYRMACHNRLIACHMFQKFILPPTPRSDGGYTLCSWLYSGNPHHICDGALSKPLCVVKFLVHG